MTEEEYIDRLVQEEIPSVPPPGQGKAYFGEEPPHATDGRPNDQEGVVGQTSKTPEDWICQEEDCTCREWGMAACWVHGDTPC